MDLTKGKLHPDLIADSRLVSLEQQPVDDVQAVLTALACLWPRHRPSWGSDPEHGLTRVTLWTPDGYGVEVMAVDLEEQNDIGKAMMYHIFHLLPLGCFSPLYGERQWTIDSVLHEDYAPMMGDTGYAGNAVQAAWSLTEQIAGGDGKLGERYELRWLYAGAPSPNLTGPFKVAGLLLPNHLKDADLTKLDVHVEGLNGRVKVPT